MFFKRWKGKKYFQIMFASQLAHAMFSNSFALHTWQDYSSQSWRFAGLVPCNRYFPSALVNQHHLSDSIMFLHCSWHVRKFPKKCGLKSLNVYTGQNTRWHVILIEIQPNAYNKYLSPTAGVILIFFGVISFCIFGICLYKLCCVLTLLLSTWTYKLFY